MKTLHSIFMVVVCCSVLCLQREVERCPSDFPVAESSPISVSQFNAPSMALLQSPEAPTVPQFLSCCTTLSSIPHAPAPAGHQGSATAGWHTWHSHQTLFGCLPPSQYTEKIPFHEVHREARRMGQHQQPHQNISGFKKVNQGFRNLQQPLPPPTLLWLTQSCSGITTPFLHRAIIYHL